MIFANVSIAVLLSNRFGLTFCVMIGDNLTKGYTDEIILFFHDSLGSLDCCCWFYMTFRNEEMIKCAA